MQHVDSNSQAIAVAVPCTMTSTGNWLVCPPSVLTVTVSITSSPGGNWSMAIGISGPGPPARDRNSIVDNCVAGIFHQGNVSSL